MHAALKFNQPFSAWSVLYLLPTLTKIPITLLSYTVKKEKKKNRQTAVRAVSLPHCSGSINSLSKMLKS